MHFSFATVATAALALTSRASAINILVGNDDGFGSAQMIETVRLLRQSGHNVVAVAPVDNQSGMGGRSVFSDLPELATASEYDIVPAGSPALGRAPFIDGVWYYNGTPAACAFVGLDYVLPNFANFTTPDLVVAGPNYGDNLGAFLYTLSGTAGYTYSSVGRGIPAIAFSGGNGEQRSYAWIYGSVSVFTVDYSAPLGEATTNIRQRLTPLVSFQDGGNETETDASATSSSSAAAGSTGAPAGSYGWGGKESKHFGNGWGKGPQHGPPSRHHWNPRYVN